MTEEIQDQPQKEEGDVERLERELREAKSDARSREDQLLLTLLSVLDGFIRLDRVVDPESLGEESTQLAKRYGLIRRKLQNTLERERVTMVNSLGQEINPELHEVIDTRESEEEEGTILEVEEEGFLYRGEILRRAKVIVAE